MQMFKMFVVVLSIFISILVSAQTVEVTEVVDGERAAKAFLATAPIASYYEYVEFNYVLDDGVKDYVFYEIRRSKDYKITKLAMGMNNDPVATHVLVDVDKGDEPLNGIPLSDAAINFHSSLWVFDQNNEVIAYGETAIIPLQSPGDPIHIVLTPIWQERFISYGKLPEGVDPEDFVLEIGNYQVPYYDHGFDVWYDPLSNDLDYVIIDLRTGNLYRSGQIDEVALAGTSLLNVTYVGGVKDLFPGDDNTYNSQENLDGFVERDGSMVSAKVYMARPLGMNFYVSTSEGFSIEIRALTDSGETPLIASNKDSGDSWLYAGSGYEKLIITIIGTGDASQDLYVWAERF